MRKFISLLVVAVILTNLTPIALAAESKEVSMPTKSIYQSVNLPKDFDSSVKFEDIENDINDYVNSRSMDIAPGTEQYMELMNNILMGEVTDIEAVTLRYFKAYASVFVSDPQNMTAAEAVGEAASKSKVATMEAETLDKSIASVKAENMKAEAEEKLISQMQPQLAPSTRAVNYNITNAKNYASSYATIWNRNFTYYPGADCTNFASQILLYGGFPTVSGEWSYIGNTLYWVNAGAFTQYWSLVRGYLGTENTSMYSVINKAQPGDFLAYKNTDTYNIYHVAFVHGKGNNTLYISQHSRNLNYVDWKTRVNSEFMETNNVIIIDFTQ